MADDRKPTGIRSNVSHLAKSIARLSIADVRRPEAEKLRKNVQKMSKEAVDKKLRSLGLDPLHWSELMLRDKKELLITLLKAKAQSSPYAARTPVARPLTSPSPTSRAGTVFFVLHKRVSVANLTSRSPLCKIPYQAISTTLYFSHSSSSAPNNSF